MNYNIEVCLECGIIPVMKDNPFHCKKCAMEVKAQFDSFNAVKNIMHLTGTENYMNTIFLDRKPKGKK